MTSTPNALSAVEMREEELRIDGLLAEFQQACENCAALGTRHVSETYKHRAILRNEVRAALLAARRERDQAEESRVTNAKLLDRALQDLAAARREVEAARAALGRIETLAHREADSFGLSGNLHEIMTECRATIARAGEKMTETTALEDRERELHASRSLREDAETVANFITGWWPGLEDGLSWPTDADHAERNPVFAAAERIRAAAATQETR